MPVVHPAELWKQSGRYFKIGPELVRFKDRGERDMVLAMTHEEVVALLLRDIVRSYRQLPIIVYHFQTKFRDEPRSRGGLIRVREFVMKDSYSCDRDWDGPRPQLPAPLRRLRADLRAARARGGRGRRRRRDHGRHAGPRVHGPQRVRRGHPGPVRRLRLRREPPDRDRRQARAAGRGAAAGRGRRDARRDDDRAAGPLPRRPREPDGQGRLLRDRRRPVRRGDRPRRLRRRGDEARPTRSRRSAGLRPAQVEEIKARGMEAGYGSPIGARDAVVVVDELVLRSPNLVAGANRVGWHVRNVNVAARLRRRTSWPTSPAPARAIPARAAARRSSSATGSRSATSSSSGPTSPSRSGPTTSARTARSTRS